MVARLHNVTPGHPFRCGCLFLLICVIAALPACTKRTGPQTERVSIDEHTFDLELAIDEESRARGLMERASIPRDGGMLFVFPNAQVRNFWMANCLSDIDIIFLDAQGRITAMHAMKTVPPQRDDETTLAYEARARKTEYSSRFPAQFAVELAPGWLDQLDLEFQDKLELDLPRLKAMSR